MIVIATDEAGYGPRLGPLVVVATRWCVPPAVADLQQSFQNVATPWVTATQTIVVDDSKRVHRPGIDNPLAWIASAAATAMGWSLDSADTLVRKLDPAFTKPPPWLAEPRSDLPLPDANVLRDHWIGEAALIDAAASILPAESMNASFAAGLNKSDLLGETTMSRIVKHVTSIDASNPGTSVVAHCDRLGGRKFYGSLIRHHFPDGSMHIVEETSARSVYELQTPGGIPLQISFTVKGDSFTPVAMSSCIAKFAREVLMRRLNHYFAERQSGLRATAGYPVDADRFLSDTATLRSRLQIADKSFVRTR